MRVSFSVARPSQVPDSEVGTCTNSPIFEDPLSLPQPPNNELVDGLYVVQLSEDASLLSSLVSLLYRPQRPVQPGSYEKVFALLAVCQKYDMEPILLDIRDKMERGTFPEPEKAQAFSVYVMDVDLFKLEKQSVLLEVNRSGARTVEVERRPFGK